MTEDQDLRERKRFALNVLWSWAGYSIVLVSGFVLPRIIGDHVGQEHLGVWDLGWSFVGYLPLLSLGVSASVNRYVAAHLARGERDLLSQTVSSCICVFAISGVLALLATAAIAIALPSLLSHRLGGVLAEAQWVVCLLGLSTALRMPLSVFGGVITGHLRYGLTSTIMAGHQALLVLGIASALLLGGGLVEMSAVVLVLELVYGIARATAAFRICPGLHISPRTVTLARMREVIGFGSKNVLRTVSRSVLHQTTNMLVIFFAGPAALAVYARSSGLVRRLGQFIHRYTRVITPTASGMDAREDAEALKRLLLRTSRHCLLMILPLVALLLVLGNDILRVWMGPAYQSGLVLVILAAGHVAFQWQRGSVALLTALNKHGWPAVANLLASIFSIILSAVFMGPLGLGILGAAVSVAACTTITYGIVVPLLTLRAVRVRVLTYMRQSLPLPLLASLPFAAWLVTAKNTIGCASLGSLLAVSGIGAAVLATTYWLLVVPPYVKDRISRALKCVRPVGPRDTHGESMT